MCVCVCVCGCVCVCVYVCMYMHINGIALQHSCSPVDLLDVCRASSLGNTSGGLLLNRDDFICDF